MSDNLPALLFISEKAVCKGMSHIFYADISERPTKRFRREQVAKRICSTCPVMEKCRQYARTNPEYGIWGGETEEERYLKGFPIPAGSRADQNRRKKARKKYEQSIKA